MPGLTTGLKGISKYKAIRAHRLSMYCSAYWRFLNNEVPLSYLNERLEKLATVMPEIKQKEGLDEQD